MKNKIIFVLISVIGLIIMSVYFAAGLITLLSLVYLVESYKPLRWFFERFANLIDILLFGLTIIATAHLGVTITMSLVVAGLGYTMIYKPYLLNRYEANKKSNRVSKGTHKLL